MDINYTWNVKLLACYPQAEGETDVVFNVIWNLYGSSEYEGSIYTGYLPGETAVTYVKGTPFTPYNELTLDTVLGWVYDVLGPEGVASAEANVAKQVEDLINPPVVYPPLPWQSNPDTLSA